MSSPTPISEEEAETLRGLLVGSDKYKSRPGILPELFTYQPSPLRTSPPNRPSVPEEAYMNKNKYYQLASGLPISRISLRMKILKQLMAYFGK